jgi:hypothetical protein
MPERSLKRTGFSPYANLGLEGNERKVLERKEIYRGF